MRSSVHITRALSLCCGRSASLLHLERGQKTLNALVIPLALCSTASQGISTSAGELDQGVGTSRDTVNGPHVPSSFCCPECGKHFIGAANLLQHRRTRHKVVIMTSAQERLECLKKENVKLRGELQEAKLQTHGAQPSQAATNTPGDSDSDNRKSFFPAAVPEGKTLAIGMSSVDELRAHEFRLGTGCSEIRCVGVVVGDVTLGYLVGSGDKTERGEEVLQFTIRVEGYRQRRAGRLMMYRNHITVRVNSPQCRVDSGDVVFVEGTYGLHRSFDLISKQAVENPVVEAGYVGLLLHSRSGVE